MTRPPATPAQTSHRARHRWFPIIVVAGVALLVLPAIHHPPPFAPAPIPVTLKLNWQPGVQFLGFFVAAERGEYLAEGLAVRIDSAVDPVSGLSIPQRVAAAEFDFAVGGFELMLAQAEGVAVTMIASLYQHGPDVFFARRSSGIRTPRDLAGRRIVMKNPVWRDRVLAPLLARVGLSLDDVVLVPGGFDMTPFYEGEVEVWAGYISNEVVRARLHGLEVVTLPVQDYVQYPSANNIYTRAALLGQQPELAVAFLRASLRGWQWALEHPEAAVDLLLARFPALATERDFHLASFDSSIPLIRSPGQPVGAVDCTRWLDHSLLAGTAAPAALCDAGVYTAATADGALRP